MNIFTPSKKQLKTKTSFDGAFFDRDYFENGRESGKGWYVNYCWMPRRSIREALAFIDYMGLDEKSYVLDFGCAKGFIVKALRMLEIKADGCDISEYALSFAPIGCWNSGNGHDASGKYTHVICKDVLEHLTPEHLGTVLEWIKTVAPKFMCVVPIGDNGKYRIPEYEVEVSHLIAEDEEWWMDKFKQHGWKIVKHVNHVKGLKDNWYEIAPYGNYVFYLEAE